MDITTLQKQNADLLLALREVTQSLDYVDRNYPNVAGKMKRAEDLKRANDLLADSPAADKKAIGRSIGGAIHFYGDPTPEGTNLTVDTDGYVYLTEAPAASPAAEKAGGLLTLTDQQILDIAAKCNIKTRTGQGAISFARHVLVAAHSPAAADAGGLPAELDYEADDGTVAAYRAGALVWHAHVYPNGEGVDDIETAKQIVAALSGQRPTAVMAGSLPPLPECDNFDPMREKWNSYTAKAMQDYVLADRALRPVADEVTGSPSLPAPKFYDAMQGEWAAYTADQMHAHAAEAVRRAAMGAGGLPLAYIADAALSMLQEGQSVAVHASQTKTDTWRHPIYAEPRPTASGAGDLFSEDDLANACIECDVPDSTYESLCLALRPTANGAAGQRGEDA